MAGDWIKMRVLLARDPKVIAMTDFLAGERAFMDWLTDPVRRRLGESAYEHLAPEVMVLITVGSLVITWGITRDRGHPDGDHLVLKHCTLDALDLVSGVPRFGAAMAHVGWAREDEAAGVVVLPNFFRDNAPVTRDRKAAHAEAQRRYRQKKSSRVMITRDDHRDDHAASQSDTEKRREEKTKKKTPLPPLELPAEIDSPELREAWAAWVRHRAEKKSALTPTAVRQQLAKLLAMGPGRALAALQHSTAQGYTGVYEPAPDRAAATEAGLLGRVQALSQGGEP